MKTISGTATVFLLITTFVLLNVLGCRKMYVTPLDSLVDSPAFLAPDSIDSLMTVYEERIENDILLIYAPSEPGPHLSCMGVALAREYQRGWRAQSTSTMACETDGTAINLGSLIGGNVRDLAVAYGNFDETLSNAVIVEWSDGAKEQATVVNGVFVNYRLENVLPLRVSLLNENNELIASKSY